MQRCPRASWALCDRYFMARALFHGEGITNLWCLRRKGAHQVRRARYRVSLARHGYVCRGSFVKVFRESLRREPHGQSAGIQLE